MAALTCFKAYDIRGKLGTELNQGIARHVAVGGDVGLVASRVSEIERVLGVDA